MMNNSYRIEIPVRFRDLDAMGHVNNAVFFTYFEIGRESFHSDHIEGNVDRSLSSFILAHISCDFIRPITSGTRLTLTLSVKGLGRKSFKYVYLLTDSNDDSVDYASGESVQVCYDYALNKSIDLAPEFRQILSNFQTMPDHG